MHTPFKEQKGNLSTDPQMQDTYILYAIWVNPCTPSLPALQDTGSCSHGMNPMSCKDMPAPCQQGTKLPTP